MKESAHNALKTGAVIVAHLIAVAAGIVMMGVGVGMGVTIFLLPLGIPLGLIGGGVFTWGVLGYRGFRRRRVIRFSPRSLTKGIAEPVEARPDAAEQVVRQRAVLSPSGRPARSRRQRHERCAAQVPIVSPG